MSRIVASGWGAVSAAGWGVAALTEAVSGATRPALSRLERTRENGTAVATEVARVPTLEDRSKLPKEPRLRRASALGKYAAGAVFEALGPEKFAAARAGEHRIAVIAQVMNGCVNYSNRFFGEVLRDPAVASPILFPETVYNAPASHLSAMLCSDGPNDTLLGDAAEWFGALGLATEWLLRDDCDLCVVVAMEELDWLNAEALGLYHKSLVPSEGAAAVIFERDTKGIELLAVPDGVGYAEEPDRLAALRRVWDESGVRDDGATLWSDGRCGVARYDRAEQAVATSWGGPRISVRRVLGESMGAAAGLQTVAALEVLRSGGARRAVVTAVGGNEGVGAACFGEREGSGR